jgi:cytochrome c oxidase subunit 2
MRTFVTYAGAALAVALAAVAAPGRQAVAAGEPQVVRVTAKKYEFDPSTITVVRGRPVRLEVTALDHDHGIEIKELGVKQRLEKGKPTIVEFTPEKAGELTFHCSVFCGLGHHGMKGKLVVVEPST